MKAVVENTRKKEKKNNEAAPQLAIGRAHARLNWEVKKQGWESRRLSVVSSVIAMPVKSSKKKKKKMMIHRSHTHKMERQQK